MSSSGQNAKDFMTALMLVLNYSRQSKNDELSNELTKLRIEHEKLSISKESAIPNAMAAGANNVDRNIAAANGGTGKSGAATTIPDSIKSIIDSNVPEGMRSYAYSMAGKESGYDPTQVSPTGASGLFQFTSGTGKQYGLVSGDVDQRKDAVANTKAFVNLTNDNAAYLKKELGREPTWSELAVAHQQGAQGAVDLIKNGKVNADNLAVNNVDASSGASGALAKIKSYYNVSDTPWISSDKPVNADTPTAIAPKSPTEYNSLLKGAAEAIKPKSEKKAELEDTTPDSNSSDATRLAMLSSDDSTTPSDTNSQVAQDTAIPTNDIDLYSMFSAKGGPVAHYADGGPVDEEDGGSNPLTNPLINPAIQQRQQPAPEDYQASAAPQGDGLGRFASDLNSAINGGFDWIAKNFNLSSGSAIPGNAQAANGREAFLRGEGGLSREQIVKLEDAADPNGQLTESLRRTAALHAGYKAYMAMGDVDKAQQFAAAMMIGCRDQAVSLGPQIIKELNKGNVSGAAKLFEQASNETPDGSELSTKVDKDGGVLARKVGADGKVAWEGKVTPQMMMQAALGISNGSEYWKQLALTAGRKDPQHSEEKDYSQGYKDFTNRVQGGNTSPMSAEEAQSMPRAEQAQAEQFRQQAIAERQRKGDDAYFNPQQQAVPTPNSNPDAAPQAPQGQAPQGQAPQGAIPTQGQQPTGGDPREEISRVIGQRPDFTPDQIKQLRSDSMSPQGKAAAVQEMKARQHDWDTRATMLWKERQQQLAEATKADRAEEAERNKIAVQNRYHVDPTDTQVNGDLDNAAATILNVARPQKDAYSDTDAASKDPAFGSVRSALTDIVEINRVTPQIAGKAVYALTMPTQDGKPAFTVDTQTRLPPDKNGQPMVLVRMSNGQPLQISKSTLAQLDVMRGLNNQQMQQRAAAAESSAKQQAIETKRKSALSASRHLGAAQEYATEDLSQYRVQQ